MIYHFHLINIIIESMSYYYDANVDYISPG